MAKKIKDKKEVSEKIINYGYRGLGKKKKHIGIFLLKKGKGYEQVGKKKLNIKSEILTSFKRKPYLIDYGNSSFEKGLSLYYVFDVISGAQLYFEGVKNPIPAEVVDLIVNKSIVKQFLSNIMRGLGVNLMSLITGLAIGGIIGLIAGMFL